MFEEILPEKTIRTIEKLSIHINHFYLAGGTGLSLQLGHRQSLDLDFFSLKIFNVDKLLDEIAPDKIFFVEKGTVHCEIENIKFSFLSYKQPLIYPLILWRKLNLADWKDIIAEKFKAISQRGTKKDFYDLYAVLKLKISIEEVCRIFKDRFTLSGINFYHVLRSLVFFEDADDEPFPVLMSKNADWEWEQVKKFFEQNIREFEKHLI